MATTQVPGSREEQDQRLNPSELHAAEQFGSGYTSSGLDQAEVFANDPANSTSQDSVDRVREEEQNPKNPNTPFISNVTGNKKPRLRTRFWRNKKALWALGIGGTTGSLVIAGFLALLPLRMEMFIQNISKQASAVPAHAVENRAEYLVTRAIAARLMQVSNGLPDSDMVFCKNGAIFCSVYKTYTTKYIEDKLGVNIEKATGNKITITPKGKTSLTSKATSWEVTTSGVNSEEGISQTVRSMEITSNGEMKRFLSEQLKANTKISNTITRYLARRILMRKYGVTNWRAFETTTNKVADIKTSFSAAMYKNTIGRIMPRTAMYLACLSSNTTCDKLLKQLSDTIDIDSIRDPKEKESAQKVQDWANKIKSLQAGTAPADGVFQKVISTNVVKALGGAVAIAGIADMGFKAIGAVDEHGALDQIANDINKTAYIGFAFGDSSGLVVNDEKMKAGDIDINTLGVASSYLDGAEQSPLMQAENGIMTVSSSTQVTRDCQASKTPSTSAAPSSDSYTYQPTALEPGQLVCPEARLVRGYKTQLDTNPSWRTLSAVAKGWNHSIGGAFDFVNGLIGKGFEALGAIIKQIPGIDGLEEGVMKALEPVMNWITSLIFDIPNIGPSAPGANNYDALSGGIRAAQNELMEQGVDETGKANGGGGTVLSDVQVASILRDQQATDTEYYARQPVIARIFNPTLTGSFAQRFLAMVPTTPKSFAMLPSQAMQSILSPFTTQAADSNVAVVNPFNLPLYGYANNDPVLTALPSVYTPASCAASAKAREASYGVHEEISPIATYTIADPCALEKQAVGALLADAGVTDDPYSLPGLDTGSTSTSQLTNSGNIAADGWAFPTDSDATLAQPFIPGVHQADDIAKNGSVPIFAARDGVVTGAGDISANPPYIQPCTGPSGEIQQAVTIKHTIGNDIYFTSYHHLAKGSILVSPGQQVKAGDKIAMMGNTGCSFGQHLHFEIWKNSIFGTNGIPIDPMTVLKRK